MLEGFDEPYLDSCVCPRSPDYVTACAKGLQRGTVANTCWK